jgi:hypothetical protein
MTKPRCDYPPDYKPGTHWALDEAWAIMDQIPVGAISENLRFSLAGQIAGSLLRRPRPGRGPRTLQPLES